MDSKSRIIAVSVSILVALSVGVISLFLLGDEESVKLKKDTMQLEAGEKLEFRMKDYMEWSKDQLKEVKVDTSDVDVDEPGDYKITITYKKRKFQVMVSVLDTTPPMLHVSGDAVEVKAGESVSVDGLGIRVDDISECELVFSNREKTKVFEGAGEMVEHVIAVDAFGNESQAAVNVRVLAVNVPEIYGEGLVNRTVYLGEHVDLLSGVSAQDAEDGDLTAQIQVDAPDLTLPGVKQVTYRVTDSEGHETTRRIRLTVVNRIEELDKVMYASQETIVYQSASAEGGQLGTLQYNQSIYVTGLDKANGWYRVSYDGVEGYVTEAALTDVQSQPQKTEGTTFQNEGLDTNTFYGTGSQGGAQYEQTPPESQFSVGYSQSR